MRAAWLCGLLAVSAACARPYPPPGGERDQLSPGLVETSPAALTTMAPGNTPVVFRFDERLSERGFGEALVLVSPHDSAVRVERGRTEVRVRMDGGWRANRVYRVVLLPGVRDLFGNERTDQLELIFSTGAAIDSTVLGGLVVDRITGVPARSGVVEAVQREGGVVYTALADSSGFFSLRYLPLGAYDISAYDDQNRNRRRDLLEPLDSGGAVTLSQPADTITQIFRVLVPDTSAPRVTGAEAVDSLHVRVTFDDYFDAELPLAAAGAQVHALPDSTAWAVGVEVMAGTAFLRSQRTDTAAIALPPLLPARDVVVRLDRVLAPGTYTITVGPITNLHGLDGSGTARFEVRRVEPPPVRPDTTRIPPPRTR
jgi:hypothetical protein